MQIKLSNGYFIEIDNLNHTLKQKYTGKNKNGEEVENERVLGYFSNLGNAIERYLLHKQSDGMEDVPLTFDEYLTHVKESNKKAVREIVSLVKGGVDNAG